jgi:preprotein translocase subunit SecG
MLIFFAVLILLASVVLALFVLVQNPKGGGLSGTFGGFSNQTMGVRQTTDFLEKGTWVLIIIIAGLCMFSSFFIPKPATTAQPGSTNQNINLPTPPPAAQYPTNNAAPGQSQPSAPEALPPPQPAK